MQQRFQHAETIAFIDSLKRSKRLTLENLEIVAAALEHWQPAIAADLRTCELLPPQTKPGGNDAAN